MTLATKEQNQLALNTEPIILEPTTNQKSQIQYYKDELEAQDKIKESMKKLNVAYVDAIKSRNHLKEKYEQELELNKNLINEVNQLKIYRALVMLHVSCPSSGKTINIFECNRGLNLHFCDRKEPCKNRLILLDKIENANLT